MADRSPPDLLVLEPTARGHGREWLHHLSAYAARCDPPVRLAFAVSPALAAALREELDDGRSDAPAILALSERAVALCTHPSLTVSALARWWTMRGHLRRTGARDGLFLEIDHLSLPLAFGLPFGPGKRVTGVLFRPSVHYTPASPPTLKERVRELRKDVLYRLMLRRACLPRLLTLDEGFPAFARRRYRGGGRVAALADPAYPPIRPDAGDRQLAERAPTDRTLLALFGVLSERKGVLALLQALAVMDRRSAARIAVLVAGEVDPPIRAEVDRLAAMLRRTQPDLWLHLECRRLRFGEIAALVDRSDAVLAPYQRFVGSSGVLMWAAGRGRPVIAQDYGLVGQLVRNHGLGVTTDTSDPFALARTLAQVAGGNARRLADPQDLAAFAADRTPEAFAATLLDPLRPRSVRPSRIAEQAAAGRRIPGSAAETGAVTERPQNSVLRSRASGAGDWPY